MGNIKSIKIAVVVLLIGVIITGCGESTTTTSGSSGNAQGPSVTTNPATDVTVSSATLNGTVNPNGCLIKVYFQWGKTDSYSGTTNSHTIGAGRDNVAVSADLTGLSPNTKYNFRIVASRDDSVFNGANQTFTTAPLPPTCTTKTASNITPDSARLNGTVNPNGVTTNAYFEYGTTTPPTITTILQSIGSGTSNVPVNADISGLSLNTHYNFRVAGINVSGTNYGNNLIFITGNSPGSKPTCITDAADNITINSTRLNGTVNPNGATTNAYFEYGLTTSYTVTTTSQNIDNGTMSVAVSDTVSGLTPNTLYNFRVAGINATGTTYGNNLTFTTITAPTCTTNPANNITINSARLNGTVNPNGCDTHAYFEYGLTTFYNFNTTLQAIGNGTSNVAVTADISGLSSNTEYNFRCASTSALGTTYGTNRTFGHWSETTFTSGSGASGVFINTQSANSDNDVILLAPTNWLQRSPTTSPPARQMHAMAYDSVRQKTVLFGGSDTTIVANNETWEWNGTNWTQRSPATSPSARDSHTMAYDSVRQRTVLFGGWDYTNWVNNNETWEWDGTNWTLRSPATSPLARDSHAMVYDSVRQKTVLFGGWDINGVVNNETWEWDGTNWTQCNPITPPSIRINHRMAYDSVRQRTVLFGGWDTNVANNETWEWDGINWTQRSPLISPSTQIVHEMVYDSVRQKTLLFGGFDTNIGANNKTWEWDGTNWTKLSPATSPSIRVLHAMVYDSVRQKTVLFGGWDVGAAGVINDTWEYAPLYVSSGIYVSPAIEPASVSSWGILTFTYNAPANTTFTVDILKSSDNSVLVSNVSSGTNLSTYSALNGITGIKLRANFATTNTGVTPTLFDWGVGFEGQ